MFIGSLTGIEINMETLFSIMIACLYTAGTYMMLRRSMVRLIIGFIILSYAANFLIFVSAFLIKGSPPIIGPNKIDIDAATVADPLTQSLILTSIVISLGVTSFAVVLIHKAYQVIKSDDLDALDTGEDA